MSIDTLLAQAKQAPSPESWIDLAGGGKIVYEVSDMFFNRSVIPRTQGLIAIADRDHRLA